jgi:hypothetical protein
MTPYQKPGAAKEMSAKIHLEKQDTHDPVDFDIKFNPEEGW